LVLVAQQTKWGFWRCFATLRQRGQWGHWKRGYRVDCARRLNRPRRGKKRVLTRPRLALEAPAILNRTWALDCMGDTRYDGRCSRTRKVLEEGHREALAIEVSTSLPSVRVVRGLKPLVSLHGAPTMRRCDNGSEFIAAALARLGEPPGVVRHHIQPGTPNQHAYIDRFHTTSRDAGLDAWVFTSLAEGRQVTEAWLEMSNTERPHRRLGRVPPRTYWPRTHAA